VCSLNIWNRRRKVPACQLLDSLVWTTHRHFQFHITPSTRWQVPHNYRAVTPLKSNNNLFTSLHNRPGFSPVLSNQNITISVVKSWYRNLTATLFWKDWRIYHNYRYWLHRQTGDTGCSSCVSPVKSHVSVEGSLSAANRRPVFSDETVSRFEGAFCLRPQILTRRKIILIKPINDWNTSQLLNKITLYHSYDRIRMTSQNTAGYIKHVGDEVTKRCK
jgi:hypothetical protein